LANALNAELVGAEARRAERSANPDSMDLFFQAVACLNRGISPNNVARARELSEQALAIDPGNVEALLTSAWTDIMEGTLFYVADPMSAIAAGEGKVMKALSLAPAHPEAHLALGFIYNCTKRAAQGIAECEHALRLNRNLAMAHSQIGLGKMFAGHPEETESHIREAFRLSPRDTFADTWALFAAMANNQLRRWEEAVAWCRRAIEANRNIFQPHCEMAMALAQLGRLDEARDAIGAALAILPNFTQSGARASWSAMSDHPSWLADLEPQFESLQMLGVPE
jgi:tetratricopeptide (TPR) repeat protein